MSTVTGASRSGNSLPSIIYTTSSLNVNTGGILVGTGSVGTTYNTYKMGGILNFSGSATSASNGLYTEGSTDYTAIRYLRTFIATSSANIT